MVGKEEDGTFEYVYRICGFPIPSQTHLLLPFFLTQENTRKPKHNNKSLKTTKNLHPHKNKNKNNINNNTSTTTTTTTT